MYTSAVLTTLLASALSLVSAAPLAERQESPSQALFLSQQSLGIFDINQLQTGQISYANSSAYIGQIKYQAEAEPLLVATGSGGVSFLSYHQTPTGSVSMYIVPHQSQPVGFGVPHGGVPSGVSTTGFDFGPRGNLRHNGFNRFWACQDATLTAENGWQIYWFGAGYPQGGLNCRGPIGIQASSPPECTSQ